MFPLLSGRVNSAAQKQSSTAVIALSATQIHLLNGGFLEGFAECLSEEKLLRYYGFFDVAESILTNARCLCVALL